MQNKGNLDTTSICRSEPDLKEMWGGRVTDEDDPLTGVLTDITKDGTEVRRSARPARPVVSENSDERSF